MLVEHRLDLDIYYPSLDAALVTRLHALGIKVNCWTCDNKEHGEALVAMGVDMITSNILE
jgi:glycerophosphoryl diester phosphodiesterase